MKKEVKNSSRIKPILLTMAAVFFVLFIILPLTLSVFRENNKGNVALIPISGVITAEGSSSLMGTSSISSNKIVKFIEEADKDSKVKIIVLEINSPGGSAVASDEIAIAVKKAEKPVIALIREIGASGGYWIASASDHIIANRMSITGSIGVISSYLEFSGLMNQYGVSYERLVAGKYKDIGTPLKKLDTNERDLLQSKLDKIHLFFIKEVAENRNLELSKVEELATGEFFLGVEAYNQGLIDELGNIDTVKEYIKHNYNVEEVKFVRYEEEKSIFDLFSGVFSNFFFNIGEGFGSMLIKNGNSAMLV